MARLVALLGTVLMFASACGDDAGEDFPEAQPTPADSIFNEGFFDELPSPPRSEPLKPPERVDDTMAATYSVRQFTPEQAIDFYAEALPARGWEVLREPHPVGAEGWRGDWVKEGFQLEISAAPSPSAETEGSPSAGPLRIAQVSLVLRPEIAPATPTTSEF